MRHVLTTIHATCLFAATPQAQLSEPEKPKDGRGLNREDMMRMEKELGTLGSDFKRIEQNHGRDGAAVPDASTTPSNVALVANDWGTCDANVRVPEDRALLIAFEPPNEEVHRKAGEWFTDGEVYGFVARWLAWIPTLSLRFHEKGGRLRGAGFSDWRESLLQMILPDVRLATVAALQCDASLRTEDQRVACFVARTGRSRATYFRLKRKLTPAALVGQLQD